MCKGRTKTANSPLALPRLTVVGAGLAGCEAAWQAARAGASVLLYEQRPLRNTPAHATAGLAELVCSNSLRSNRLQSGPGLLQQELRLLDSLIIRAAEVCRVPAGSALAVDRARFSVEVERLLASCASIELRREPLDELPTGPLIVASGPLTSESLAQRIIELTGRDALHFYDATSPIVDSASIDLEQAFFGARYGRGAPEDYLNCPLTAEEYAGFIKELLQADRLVPRSFENERYFEGCLPIEVMAERGEQTLCHGPMKPVGLIDPRIDRRPFAVVQLRKENLDATCYNLVGFQTRLRRPEQDRVLRLVPALRHAEFLRYGAIHRNTYLNSPGLLDEQQRLINRPTVRFAGQITGVEGYIESTASGLLAGLYAAAELHGIDAVPAPRATAHGSLMQHVSGSDPARFAPSNIHFGLLPPADPSAPHSQRKQFQAERALEMLQAWIDSWVKPLRAL